MNETLLHLEGAIVLILSLYFYYENGFSWLLFIILLLTPDLSMLGYLINQKVGTIVYNLFHTNSVAIIVILIGCLLGLDTILALGIIWTSHIGMDRMLGYGLKYESSFKDTHLQRV